MKVKNDHPSKFFNLSNWKETAWKNQGFNEIRTRDLREYRWDALPTGLWSPGLRAVSLFSWSFEQNVRECTRAWMKARDGKLPGVPPRFSRLAASPLDARSSLTRVANWRKKERLLKVYEATHWERGQFIEFISSREKWTMWSINIGV